MWLIKQFPCNAATLRFHSMVANSRLVIFSGTPLHPQRLTHLVAAGLLRLSINARPFGVELLKVVGVNRTSSAPRFSSITVSAPAAQEKETLNVLVLCEAEPVPARVVSLPETNLPGPAQLSARFNGFQINEYAIQTLAGTQSQVAPEMLTESHLRSIMGIGTLGVAVLQPYIPV